ncbi:hypothetical protein Ddye_023677 [Dipteronia dyeriana]|uniref:Reverse transcriptase domain-containing protein n=1 Tax=Dipteronia dyeriana TaxID=168575 RepID=A0AAD9TUD6_9ROSI|nr:hypothetical protein Ddye_023677 [Dipteronia dyeriana]
MVYLFYILDILEPKISGVRAAKIIIRLGFSNRLMVDTQVSELEIKQIVFFIGRFKAPDPNEVPAIFFQKIWDTCKDVIVKLIVDCFKFGCIPDATNQTLISLNPKVSNPTSMTQLRPIILCNTLYKIISKVIVQRLKELIPDLVSPNQVFDGVWKHVKVSIRGPVISHLFFIDYLILFGNAYLSQAKVMKECLDSFCWLSGQEVSFPKSRVFYSKNISNFNARFFTSACGSPITMNFGNYLGNPLIHDYKEILDNWMIANYVDEKIIDLNPRYIVWSPPLKCWVKLNVDGSVNPNSGSIAAGGLKIVWEGGFRKVLVESDSQNSVIY